MNRNRRGRDADPANQPLRRPVVKPKLSPTRLRIVAGDLGGRKIDYNGDPATRPMKERTRESVFSLLGGYLYNHFVIDLFGGTGILAFESISRGAERAIVLEMSRSTVATMLASMETLGLKDRIDVFNVDTLRWLRNIDMARRDWPDLPWIIYCCPPYKMWTSDGERLCQGLLDLYAASPVGSRIVCESEWGYDLPAAMPTLDWDVRNYDPANISICRKD